jgi:hypothetical protein
MLGGGSGKGTRATMLRLQADAAIIPPPIGF